MAGHTVSSCGSREAGRAFPTTVVALRGCEPHCGTCGMRKLCLPAGLSPEGMRQLDSVVSHRVHVRKRDSLYRAGENFTALYALRLGTFKSLVLTEDGHEQIIGYHMSGDILGLDGIGGDRYGCQSVALADGEVGVLPFQRMDELAHGVPLLPQDL